MKKLPIGIQTFSKLIEQNYLYIDKTEEIYNLIGFSFDAKEKNISDYKIKELIGK